MKNIFSFLLLFLFAATAFSQQDYYSWRVGVTGGAMTYYGDLSTQPINIQSPWLDITNNLEHTSYGINIENNFSDAWGWRLSATHGRFQATDRVINWDNQVQLTSNTYRSINVQTDISNVFFSFNYYTDNDVLLSSKALISPYFNFGIGLTRFNPYADLLDANDQKYYYWSDLTIRDSPEIAVPPNGGNIIEQDGNFETNLRDIQTEGVEYNTTTLSFPVGVGLKFRVSEQININLEAQAIYTLTDYLDDVSGKYITNSADAFQNYASNPNNSSDIFRGTPDGLKDIYGYLSLGVYFNFSSKTRSFLPPVLFFKDSSLDKNQKTKPNTTITKASVDKSDNIENGGLRTVEDEDIIVVSTPDTIDAVIENETEILQNPIVVENPISVDSIQQIDIVKIEPTVNITQQSEPKTIISENKKEVTNDIEVINLDGSPAIDTVQKVISFPTMKAPTLTLDTINTTDMEGMVIKIDDIEKEKEASKITQLPVTKADTVFIKTPVQASTKLLTEVETSRLELAQLQQKYNTAITQSEQNKTEIAALQGQLDSMQMLFKNYEQYNNSIAIQANEEFSKPENQAIAEATQEMAKEMAYLKTQLELSNSNYKKAYENAQANQKESQAKIESLEQKVKQLKKEVKEAKQPKRNPLRIINPSRSKKEKEVTEVKSDSISNRTNLILIPSTEVVIPAVKDSVSATSIIKKEEKIINEVPPIKKEKTVVENKVNNTVSEEVIEVKVDSISKALELKQAATLAEKRAEVNELNQRLILLEKQLQSVKKEESNSEKALQQQLEALAKELNALKNKPIPAVVTAPKPKPSNIKEIIKGYKTTNVYFNVGKSTVGIEYESKLQKIASLMLLHQELNVVITGYTDKSGNPDVNFRLSQKRASNVKDYLMQQGVQSNRLQTDFQGSNKATKANDPFARRVEIILISSLE